MQHLFIAKRWPNGDLDIVQRDAAVGERVHVFTDADLGRDGHVGVSYLAVSGKHDGHIRFIDTKKPGHVAIPVEQYVRIFGDL